MAMVMVMVMAMAKLTDNLKVSVQRKMIMHIKSRSRSKRFQFIVKLKRADAVKLRLVEFLEEPLPFPGGGDLRLSTFEIREPLNFQHTLVMFSC